jgi:hypothetical protein
LMCMQTVAGGFPLFMSPRGEKINFIGSQFHAINLIQARDETPICDSPIPQW